MLALGMVAALHAVRPAPAARWWTRPSWTAWRCSSTQIHALRRIGMWQDPRGVNLLDGGAPFYDTYECADGRYLAVGALEPRFYDELVRRTGFPLHAGRGAGPHRPGELAGAARGVGPAVPDPHPGRVDARCWPASDACARAGAGLGARRRSIRTWPPGRSSSPHGRRAPAGPGAALLRHPDRAAPAAAAARRAHRRVLAEAGFDADRIAALRRRREPRRRLTARPLRRGAGSRRGPSPAPPGPGSRAGNWAATSSNSPPVIASRSVVKTARTASRAALPSDAGALADPGDELGRAEPVRRLGARGRLQHQLQRLGQLGGQVEHLAAGQPLGERLQRGPGQLDRLLRGRSGSAGRPGRRRCRSSCGTPSGCVGAGGYPAAGIRKRRGRFVRADRRA